MARKRQSAARLRYRRPTKPPRNFKDYAVQDMALAARLCLDLAQRAAHAAGPDA